MKTIKALLVGLIAAIAMLVATPQAQAQSATPEMRRVLAQSLSKSLPMTVSTGMTWTKCTLSQDTKVMIWTFQVNPTQMGTTLAQAKTEFNKMTQAQWRAMLLNQDMKQLLDMMECDLQVILVLPDKSTTKVMLKR